APGSDADIVLFDPNKERTISVDTHHMNVDYSALEGMKVTGEPVTVLSRGEYVIKDKQLVGKPGTGKFLKCDKFDAHAQETGKKAGDWLNNSHVGWYRLFDPHQAAAFFQMFMVPRCPM